MYKSIVPYSDGEEFDFDEFSFTPMIKCESASANRGMIKFIVSNIDALWSNSAYDAANEPVFRILYRMTESRHTIMPVEWMEKKILIANIFDDTFFLLLDSKLGRYRFEFKMQARDTQYIDSWMKETRVYRIIIPPFTMDGSFDLSDWSDWLEFGHLMHPRRFTIDRQYVTEIMTVTTFPGQSFGYDDTHKKIWNCIEDNYTASQALDYCYDFEHKANVILVLHKTISRFVTKNIFEFLFTPHFDTHASCLIDSNDGMLEMKNVRTNYIRSYEPADCSTDVDWNEEYPNVEMVARFDDLKDNCDYCWISLGEYEMFYSCNRQDGDKHHLCLNCVSTVIRLNLELKKVLHRLLSKELVEDCIHEIADYVIGSVHSLCHDE